MEKIYKPINYGATDRLDTGKYFEEFHKILGNPKKGAQTISQIFHDQFYLNLSPAALKYLQQETDIELLTIPLENRKLPQKTAPSNGLLVEKHRKPPENVRLYSISSFNAKKQVKIPHFLGPIRHFVADLHQNVINQDTEEQPYTETFLYRIQLLRPFAAMRRNDSEAAPRITTDVMRIMAEIDVIGPNTLKQLSDVIACSSDWSVLTQVPDGTPINDVMALKSSFSAKERYPTRMFFIENTFYNLAGYEEYARVVRKWAVQQGLVGGANDFRSATMESVTFDKLKLRLGYSYLFMHQGDCEHVICFSDARAVRLRTSDFNEFPRIARSVRMHMPLCLMCSALSAQWVAMHSARLPNQRTPLCTTCCQSYLFVDGKKIEDTCNLYPILLNDYDNDNDVI